MKTKQVKFRDPDMVLHGGILVDDKYIICGCCGGVFEVSDGMCEIVEEYENWVSFEEDIVDSLDDETGD